MGQGEQLTSDDQFFSVVQRFIETGGDIDRKDAEGNTLLLMAANKGNAKAVEFLLSKGANAQLKENLGWSAAHFAALKNSPEIMQMVLDAGCPVDGVNMSNETPLLVAAMYCHDRVIELLLETYNAKVNVVDWKGSSPLQLVSELPTDVAGDRARALSLLETYAARQRPITNEPKDEGRRKFDKQDYLGAAQDYTDALSMDGTDVDVHMQRSICMSKLGLYNDAVCDTIKVLGLDPKRKEAHYLCIESYMKLKNYKEAVKAADFGLQSCGEDEELMRLRQEALDKLNHPEEV